MLRHAAGLLLGEDLLPIDPNVERTWSTHADLGGNLELTLYGFFQAHGLSFDVASHETALDLDVHRLLLKMGLPENSLANPRD